MSLKYLLITFVFTLIGAFLYMRLRPYLALAQRMFRLVREARRVGINRTSEPSRRAGASSERLIRCATCGTWIPSTRAIKLGTSGSPYCSYACLENAAGVFKRKAADKR